MFRVLSLAALAAAVSAPVLAQTAPIAPVESVALARDAFSTGVLDRSEGALGDDAWRGSIAGELQTLLELAPARPASPAIGSLLRRALASSAAGPAGAPASLGGEKLAALARAGFIDEAIEIEGFAIDAAGDPSTAKAMAIADLLSGRRDSACSRSRRITDGVENTFWVRLRIVCYAASSEFDAAELAFGILRENGGLSAADEPIFVALTSGGKPKTPVWPRDAVQLAALQAMKAPIGGVIDGNIDGGVLVAVAKDSNAPWPVRLEAARAAAASGVFAPSDLRALWLSAPKELNSDYFDIASKAAPELLRDRTSLIAAAIAKATDFISLYAVSALYADQISAAEGVIVDFNEMASLALARLTIGDTLGAERWLTGAAAQIAPGRSDEDMMRFIDIVSLLAIVEPAGAARVGAKAGVSTDQGVRRVNGESFDGTPLAPARLAPVIAAAIGAADRGSAGEAALAALAVSPAAAAGDPVALSVFIPALRAAGLESAVRQFEAERALGAFFPKETLAASTQAASTQAASMQAGAEQTGAEQTGADQAGGALGLPRIKPPKAE